MFDGTAQYTVTVLIYYEYLGTDYYLYSTDNEHENSEYVQ